MDFDFSDEQYMLRDSVRDFLSKDCTPTEIRRIWEHESGRSPERWKKLGDTNFPKEGWEVVDGCLHHKKGKGGDIVTVDAQGFVTIKGRAKRFAKIGGEMISLAAVEMIAADLWPNALSGIVTMPDPRKGERLILVTQQKDATRQQFMSFARERGASELMIPAEVMVLDKLPILGTGKVDQVSLNKLVQERVAARTPVAV